MTLAQMVPDSTGLENDSARPCSLGGPRPVGRPFIVATAMVAGAVCGSDFGTSIEHASPELAQQVVAQNYAAMAERGVQLPTAEDYASI